MAVTHTTAATGTDSGDGLISKNAWNENHTIANDTVTEAMLSIADNTTKNVSTSAHGFAPKGDGNPGKYLNANGAYAVPDLSPDFIQRVMSYNGGTTAHALTVAVATGAPVVIVMSEGRGATSITQTNVTWTNLYTGNNGTYWVEFWAGTITGTAGTTCTVNFASSTKSECDFFEFNRSSPFTTAGTAVTKTGLTTGTWALLGPISGTAGAVCIFGFTAFNADIGYGTCSKPVSWGTVGSCLASGSFFLGGSPEYLTLVFSGTSGGTAFSALAQIT